MDKGGAFDLSGTEYWANMAQYGFASGASCHADRLATIRSCFEQYGVMIDTHTADGLKVAKEHLKPGLTMLVLETAQPAKFEETIREALNREPVRPAELAGIEALPQQVTVMAPDVEAVKAFVSARV